MPATTHTSLKRQFACTLTDVSPAMQALSLELNRMRAPRRRYAFAAAESNLRRVFVHDAVMHLTTEDDLAAAVHTASIHTAPGGVAIFAPDFVREALREMTEVIEGAEGNRAMRCLAWTWDPDPPTRPTWSIIPTCSGRRVGRGRHDRHIEGVFQERRGFACSPKPGLKSRDPSSVR